MNGFLESLRQLKNKKSFDRSKGFFWRPQWTGRSSNSKKIYPDFIACLLGFEQYKSNRTSRLRSIFDFTFAPITVPAPSSVKVEAIESYDGNKESPLAYSARRE